MVPPAGHDLLLALAVAAAPGALGPFLATWPLALVAANVPPVLRLGQPVLSGLLAYAFLGEAITQAHVFGGLLTLAGVLGATLVVRRSAVALVADEQRGTGDEADDEQHGHDRGIEAEAVGDDETALL